MYIVEDDIVGLGDAGGAGRWWADSPNVRYEVRYADALYLKYPDR